MVNPKSKKGITKNLLVTMNISDSIIPSQLFKLIDRRDCNNLVDN